MFWLVYKQSLYWKFKDGENGLNWSKVSSKFMIIIESCKTIEWLLGKFPLGINFGPQSTTHSTKCWTTQRKSQATLDK